MGGAITKNIIDNHMSATAEVLNESIQDCGGDIDQEQSLVIGGKHSTLRNVDMSSNVAVDFSCSQTASAQTDVDQKLSAKMEQMAKSVMGAISLNPGTAEASNITKLCLNLGTAVHSTFNQKCGSKLHSRQSLVAGGEDNYTDGVTMTTATSIIKSCGLTSDAITKARAQLDAAIKQVASAEKKGLSLAFLVVIVLGILGGLYFGGVTLATSPVFWIGCLTAIAGYFALAYFAKWWPFLVVPEELRTKSKDKDKDEVEDKDEDKDENQPLTRTTACGSWCTTEEDFVHGTVELCGPRKVKVRCMKKNK